VTPVKKKTTVARRVFRSRPFHRLPFQVLPSPYLRPLSVWGCTSCKLPSGPGEAWLPILVPFVYLKAKSFVYLTVYRIIVLLLLNLVVVV